MDSIRYDLNQSTKLFQAKFVFSNPLLIALILLYVIPQEKSQTVAGVGIEKCFL